MIGAPFGEGEQKERSRRTSVSETDGPSEDAVPGAYPFTTEFTVEGSGERFTYDYVSGPPTPLPGLIVTLQRPGGLLRAFYVLAVQNHYWCWDMDTGAACETEALNRMDCVLVSVRVEPREGEGLRVANAEIERASRRSRRETDEGESFELAL